nr:MAG TPA: hypothetical protein [Bacteriophage sp.]
MRGVSPLRYGMGLIRNAKHKNTPPNVAASSGAGGTNLTTRYCVRAYCSTRERKRQ